MQILNAFSVQISSYLYNPLLNRLLKHLEQSHLPESQCGFRAGRGSIDMIFAARQIQEKSVKQSQGLYLTFVDLKKSIRHRV